MRIGIMTVGSRGDVQPFLALALGLVERGHSVILAAPPESRKMVEARGVAFRELGIDLSEMFKSPEAKRMLYRRGKLGVMEVRKRFAADLFLRAGRAAAGIFRESDIVVFKNALTMIPGIAKLMGAKTVEAALIPLSPTGTDAGIAFGGRNLGAPLNRLLTTLTADVIFSFSRPTLDALAKEIPGLAGFKDARLEAKRRRREEPLLCAFSPSVYPKPADWGSKVMLTGCWFLPEDPSWTPSPELSNFLAAGPKPVYVGFGSMPNLEPERCLAIVRSSLRSLGLRGVVNKGWAGLGAGQGEEDGIFFIDDVPHSWLFPRMAAAVHHGGAGTTAASLRAGIPSVVVPHMGDQPFWAKRLLRLGAAPEAIPARRFSEEALTRALAAALDGRMAAAAAEISRKLAREDGVARACEAIEKAATGPGHEAEEGKTSV
jgi:UDP:flavonoid glycosyltransferase YjiC (YdhE family)